MQELTINELQEISGGTITKYPNGVYCDSESGTCNVNWNEAIPAIGKIVVNGWIQNGPWAHR